VLERLRRQATPLPPGVTAVDAHTDLLNHLEDFAAYDDVVLVDAVLDPDSKLGEPGRVVVLREETFQSWTEASPGVHEMTPLLAVKLFRTLYPQAETKFTLVGLAVDQLTSKPIYATEARIAEALAAVQSLIA
jgi:hydrogenase maturation protease